MSEDHARVLTASIYTSRCDLKYPWRNKASIHHNGEYVPYVYEKKATRCNATMPRALCSSRLCLTICVGFITSVAAAMRHRVPRAASADRVLHGPCPWPVPPCADRDPHGPCLCPCRRAYLHTCSSTCQSKCLGTPATVLVLP